MSNQNEFTKYKFSHYNLIDKVNNDFLSLYNIKSRKHIIFHKNEINNLDFSVMKDSAEYGNIKNEILSIQKKMSEYISLIKSSKTTQITRRERCLKCTQYILKKANL